MAFVDNSTGGRVIRQGLMPIKVTVDDTCDVGDLIGYDVHTSAAWEKADADAKIPAVLIAGEKCETSGDEITCYKMAYVDFGSGSTATAGDLVYTSDTAGDYAATPGGWVHQCTGQMISATMGFINPSSQPLVGFGVTGTAGSLWTRTEIQSGKTTAATQFCGGRIDTKILSDATLGGEFVASLWVLLQSQDVETLAEGSILRLEDNSSAGCGVDAFINMQASGADQPDYIFNLNPSTPASGCWVAAGSAKTGAAGWLKISTQSGDRYINMYSG